MTETGEGWAVGGLDDMGEGPGFRKVRKELGVTAFGVNAVVLPPGYARAGTCTSARRSCTSCTAGRSSSASGTASAVRSGRAASPASTPATVRSFRNVSEQEDAVYVCVGGRRRLRGARRPAAGGRDDGAPDRVARFTPVARRSRISVSSRASSDGAGVAASASRRIRAVTRSSA